jgi:bifunctional DNA-binding transcriptional regulator/antitoxin component of YhaV-PrlF toxin-antitoxin module
MPRRPKSLPGFSDRRTRYAASRVRAPSGAAARRQRRLPPPEALPDGTVRYFLVLGPKGRVLLPADIRAAMELEAGDIITAWLKGGELRMHSHSHGLRKVQEEARSIASADRYASEELIAERRAESAREEKESLTRRGRAGRKKRR